MINIYEHALNQFNKHIEPDIGQGGGGDIFWIQARGDISAILLGDEELDVQTDVNEVNDAIRAGKTIGMRVFNFSTNQFSYSLATAVPLNPFTSREQSMVFCQMLPLGIEAYGSTLTVSRPMVLWVFLAPQSDLETWATSCGVTPLSGEPA